MQTRVRAALAVMVALAPLFAAGITVPASAASCAPATTSGGDWTSYGHDLANTRSQPDEHVLDTRTVGGVVRQWVATAEEPDDIGRITSTPVVANGCVFVMASLKTDAELFAFNADDGSPVWSSGPLDGGNAALGGAGVGSPAVAGGRVFALVSKPNHPYVVAYDLAGTELWSGEVDDQPHSFINASAVVIPSPSGDVVFVGFATEENFAGGRGGWSIFDAATGVRRVHEYSVNAADFGRGEFGASLWATPAVDGDGFVYAPTGNPSSAHPEARNADSILKIDGSRSSPTFGALLSAYHGDPESYVGALQKQPACDGAPDAVKVLGSWSATCAQLDLDFGASPNLFTNSLGQSLLGALQKSGTFHAVWPDTMAGAWTATMGAPGFPFNAASTATDGSKSVFGVGTPGGAMQAITTDDGRLRWTQPVADGLHYQSVSYANGVTYGTDGSGFLNAWDAATGLPLLKRNLALDTGASEVNSGSGGIAIARHHLFVANGSHLIAFGLEGA